MEELEELITKNKIVIFSKSGCINSKSVRDSLNSLKCGYKEVQVDKIGEKGVRFREALFEKTGQKSIPNTFVKGWHVGGSKYTSKCAKNGTIQKMLNGTYEGFDFDLMVIGEGPGASTAALESAKRGMKVAFCNYVMPTSENRKLGITKRNLNMICDLNKQIQRAGIIGTNITDASQFGWEINENVSFNWEKLITSIQNHAMDINSKCVNNLGELLIMCFNALPRFESVNTVKLTDNERKERVIKAKRFIIASSTYADNFNVPGSGCGIVPDDIFCLPHHPGKVIVIGCSEAGLCCAGNLIACSIRVTLLVRKHSLEYYDEQMVDKLIEDLEFLGVKVYRNGELKRIEILSWGKPGEYATTLKMDGGKTVEENFNTIVYAEGQLPNLKQLNLVSIGVECDQHTGQIITNKCNATTVKNIYALGNVCKGQRANTFVSRTAKLLVQRLYAAKDDTLNIIAIPTLVCSSLDYGFVGISEEGAIEKYGSSNIEVYHAEFKPMEYRFSSRFQKCYVKIVCVKSEKERVVGLHVNGPYAGDVIQGFALGMKLGARRSDFQKVIGIHPTTAEELTSRLRITKSSGESVELTDC